MINLSSASSCWQLFLLSLGANVAWARGRGQSPLSQLCRTWWLTGPRGPGKLLFPHADDLGMSGRVRSINGMVGLEVVSLSENVSLLCSADVLTAGQRAFWPFLRVGSTILPLPKASQTARHTAHAYAHVCLRTNSHLRICVPAGAHWDCS